MAIITTIAIVSKIIIAIITIVIVLKIKSTRYLLHCAFESLMTSRNLDGTYRCGTGKCDESRIQWYKTTKIG